MKTLTNSEDLSDNRIRIPVPDSFPAIFSSVYRMKEESAEIYLAAFRTIFRITVLQKKYSSHDTIPLSGPKEHGRGADDRFSLYFSSEKSVSLSHRTQLHGHRYTVKHPRAIS